MDHTTAPKADALPGCATPRLAESLPFPAIEPLAEEGLRGKARRNEARNVSGTPGIVPNQSPMTLGAITGGREGRGDFILRRYVVSVMGWGESTVLAASRGKALADTWRCDAFNGYTFGEFLKVSRCRLDWYQPKPVEITVLGKRALGLGHNSQYVQFVYPGKDVVLNAHPLDVLPESARPSSYRSAA